MSVTQPSRNDLGQAIRRLRIERGLTIEELARRADIHATYLSRIERACNNATWEKICALASALDLAASAIALAAEQELERRSDDADGATTDGD